MERCIVVHATLYLTVEIHVHRAATYRMAGGGYYTSVGYVDVQRRHHACECGESEQLRTRKQ